MLGSCYLQEVSGVLGCSIEAPIKTGLRLQYMDHTRNIAFRRNACLFAPLALHAMQKLQASSFFGDSF